MHRLLPSVAALCIVLSMTSRAQVVTSTLQTGQAGQTRDISPEKRALVRELLEVTGARKNSAAIFNTMFDQMEKQMPEIGLASGIRYEGDRGAHPCGATAAARRDKCEFAANEPTNEGALYSAP